MINAKLAAVEKPTTKLRKLPMPRPGSLTAKHFGQRLKAARSIRNYTQKQLADLIGMHVSHISQFETGRRHPDLANFTRCANALGVSADYLLGKGSIYNTSDLH